MNTYPNQKVIVVKKPIYKSNFLSIGSDEWIEACNNLTYNAFKLYLYMADNADEYKFALSKKTIQKKINMSDNTYANVVKELIDKKYLVQNEGNVYNFYTIPQYNGIYQSSGIYQSNVGAYTTTVGDNTPIEWGSIPQYNGGEITNTSNTTTTKNKNPEDREEKKRVNLEKNPRNMSDNELMEYCVKIGRNDNPDVMKATRAFYGIDDRTLYDIEDGLKDRSIEYNDLKNKYGIPKDLVNKRIYGLIEVEKHWRQTVRFKEENGV